MIVGNAMPLIGIKRRCVKKNVQIFGKSKCFDTKKAER